MKISDIVEHAKGRRAKIYNKKPINTIEPKKPEAPMNEEEKELGTITAPPGPDGNVQMKTPDGKTTTMPAKDMVAKDDTTQQVPATPGSDLVGDKVVQTSEDYEEDEHPSHAHFHDWMNSEHAPHDDDSGDHDIVFNKALHFLSDKVHPGDIENYAHHLTHKFHGGGIDEESSVYPSRNDPALAAQAAATQPGHQSVMPSRNAAAKEGQDDHGPIGGDPTDMWKEKILAQPEDDIGHGISEMSRIRYLAGLKEAGTPPAADIDPGERILDVQTTPEIDAYIEANTVRDADGDVDFAGSLGKMMSGASEKMDIKGLQDAVVQMEAKFKAFPSSPEFKAMSPQEQQEWTQAAPEGLKVMQDVAAQLVKMAQGFEQGAKQLTDFSKTADYVNPMKGVKSLPPQQATTKPAVTEDNQLLQQMLTIAGLR